MSTATSMYRQEFVASALRTPPPFPRRHASDHLSTGDAMDYGHRSSLGELVGATLRTLERAGGPGAAAHIRHFVPDYTSCLAPVWMAHKP